MNVQACMIIYGEMWLIINKQINDRLHYSGEVIADTSAFAISASKTFSTCAFC